MGRIRIAHNSYHEGLHETRTSRRRNGNRRQIKTLAPGELSQSYSQVEYAYAADTRRENAVPGRHHDGGTSRQPHMHKVAANDEQNNPFTPRERTPAAVNAYGTLNGGPPIHKYGTYSGNFYRPQEPQLAGTAPQATPVHNGYLAVEEYVKALSIHDKSPKAIRDESRKFPRESRRHRDRKRSKLSRLEGHALGLGKHTLGIGRVAVEVVQCGLEKADRKFRDYRRRRSGKNAYYGNRRRSVSSSGYSSDSTNTLTQHSNTSGSHAFQLPAVHQYYSGGMMPLFQAPYVIGPVHDERPPQRPHHNEGYYRQVQPTMGTTKPSRHSSVNNQGYPASPRSASSRASGHHQARTETSKSTDTPIYTLDGYRAEPLTHHSSREDRARKQDHEQLTTGLRTESDELSFSPGISAPQRGSHRTARSEFEWSRTSRANRPNGKNEQYAFVYSRDSLRSRFIPTKKGEMGPVESDGMNPFSSQVPPTRPGLYYHTT